MRSGLDNKVAVSFAVVGVALMIMTIVWRINPVEGSVVPDFLTGNPLGRIVVGCLLVTCMPVWIISFWLTTILPIPDPMKYHLTFGLMILLQALAYGLVGAGVSGLLRKISGKP